MIGESVQQEAFAPGEVRALTVRADRIDPSFVVDGKAPDVDARMMEDGIFPARYGPRGYLLTGLPRAVAPEGRMNVKLWNRDPADDGQRLERIAEHVLRAREPLDGNEPR